MEVHIYSGQAQDQHFQRAARGLQDFTGDKTECRPENNYTENPEFDWSIITFFSMKHQF